MFDAAGAPFLRANFDRAELSARTEVARKVSEGQTGTERDVWRPYFQAVLRGSFAGRVDDGLLEAVGAGLRAAHEHAHLWSWCPPDVREALDVLHAERVRVAVITNADGRMESAIQAAGIRDRFEFVLDSADVGVSKPDPRIFTMATERLALSPGECWYVGDLFNVDVKGAHDAGLGAVLVDPVGQFEELPVQRIASVRDLPTLLAS